MKRKKHEQSVSWGQTAALSLLILGTIVFVKVAYFSPPQTPVPEQETVVQEPVQKPEEENLDVPKSYASVYFIGQNANKEEVYKVVKREYNAQRDGTKLNFAIKNLLKGPSAKEESDGIYSEIPKGTKLLSLEEKPDKIIIDLSSDFEQGGGTDGLYKRLYQLIKTANKNTALDVYLYINGKQAEVIGGEGIMINQPLNSKSLGE